MPMPLLRSALLICTTVAVLATGGATAATGDSASVGAAGWQGLLGGRPSPQLGGRSVVVLKFRSLADRVAEAGGKVGEAEMQAWTRQAQAVQRRAIARLAVAGIVVQPEFSYVRVVNAFSAALDPRLVPALERHPLVAGVYPVRAAYPAAVGDLSVLATPTFGPDSGRRPALDLPGADGSGVTVALLDTGVDLAHPYLDGRLAQGIDILAPGGNAQAAQNPTEVGRPERHGTELAGLIAGVDGPAGLHGVAPGATILPIRIAGWQPDTSGGVAVYARTDQLLAGIEAAVDPDQDGSAHDGAKIALVGLVEPFASFADGPLARAAAGASALDTLVVAPAGNDGPAGPGYGSVGAPAGAPAALAVGATDARVAVPTVHVLLRAGLRVLMGGRQPLGGAIVPEGTVSARVVVLPQRARTRVDTTQPLDRLFDASGYSTVAGRAVLLPSGPTDPEVVSELAAAGARAVIVDGLVPAGSLGLDEPVDVPILGVASDVAQEIRQSLRRGVPIELAVGAASQGGNAELAATAPFSSTGLSLAGGAKPELLAPGVGLVTAEPGRAQGGVARYGTISGTSAAAALVAGAAALLADARPDLDAAGLRGALVAGARRRAGGAAAPLGVVDPQAASSVELVAEPASITIEALRGVPARGRGSVVFRNVSRRPLSFRLQAASVQPGVSVRFSRSTLSLAPGTARTVDVTVIATALPDAPAAVAGALRAVGRRGGTLRVAWRAAVPLDRPVLGSARLSQDAFTPDDIEPAVLSFVAGRVDGAIDRPQILPLESLEVALYLGSRRLGLLTRLRHLLPGQYAIGVTGRGPGGAVLRPGSYRLRLTGAPAGGGRATVLDVPFRVR